MSYTIEEMQQHKFQLSQQITQLLKEFVDKYDITDVHLDIDTHHIIGQKKCSSVIANVIVEY